MDIFRGTGLDSLGGQAPCAQSLGDYCPKGHRPNNVIFASVISAHKTLDLTQNNDVLNANSALEGTHSCTQLGIVVDFCDYPQPCRRRRHLSPPNVFAGVSRNLIWIVLEATYLPSHL